jgi:peptidoglycan/LPS O-acetylase OafA/YrhL
MKDWSISGSRTLIEKFDAAQRRPSGFDYLRLILAFLIVFFHAYIIVGGIPAMNWLFDGPPRPLIVFLVPSFFALSGYLVASSLERNSLPAFFMLRGLRILPALAIEISLSALVIGPLFTTVSLQEYFSSRKFWVYFSNIVGRMHYVLPGVFADLPLGQSVNGQLWTIPVEFDCYIILGVLSLVGLAAKARRLLIVAIATIIVMTCCQLLSTSGYPQLSPAPGWMLIAACLCGVWMYAGRKHIPYNWPLFCIAVVLCVVLLASPNLVFLAAMPLCYVTIFIGLLNPRRLPLVMSGDYSYGIFLYSFPIQQSLVALFPEKHWLFNFVVGLAVSATCAVLSWHYVESRIVALRKPLLIRLTKFIASLDRAGFPATRERRDAMFATSFFWPMWRAWKTKSD